MKTVKLQELVGAKVESLPPDDMLEVVSTESLSLGEHTFSLIVVDGAGNESLAAKVTITVIDTTAPTAKIAVLDVNKLVATQIEYGSTFYLSAEGSVDTPTDDLGGKIVSYIWTLDSAV